MDNTILITGASGQIGSYLYEALVETDAKVIGISRKDPRFANCDLCNSEEIFKLINKHKPNRIFHLAAYHFHDGAWNSPSEIMQANLIGTINILEAIRKLREIDNEYNPIIVNTSSAMVYGDSFENYTENVTEDVPLLPATPYALSKVAVELITAQYHKAYNLKTIVARLFAVISPKASHGSAYDFTRKAVMVEKGLLDSPFEVGDINVVRTVIDARDVVHALILLSHTELAIGKTYNVCAESHKVSDILNTVQSQTFTPFKVIVKKNLYPTAERIIIGSHDKLSCDTGWTAQYTLAQSIKDMLEHWRRLL
jgi:nucleoside-diphosphate-sugar epimerase